MGHLSMKKMSIESILLSVVCSLILISIFCANDQTVFKYTDEGGIVETLSAVFYFAGLLLSVYFLVFKKSEYKLVLCFWIFCCFVFLGEETSWFQAILKYETPAWMASINKQEEFNIHNLVALQGGAWLDEGEMSKFHLKMLFSSQNLFRIFFFAYFFIMPLLAHSDKLNMLKRKVIIPVPAWSFVGAVWSVICLSFGLSIFSSGVMKAGIAEVREMFYALFICSYLFLHKQFPVKGEGKTSSRANT